IRALSAFRRSLCSFSTLRFGGPTPTSPQVGGFDSHCFFQSLSRALFSALTSSSVGPPLHFTAHLDWRSPLVSPLLALPYRRRVRIFMQALLTSPSMPAALCRRLNAATLAFKYRSRGGMCVSVFSAAMGVFLY